MDESFIRAMRAHIVKKERERQAKARGWGWPGNSRKAHYFVNGRSLCSKWMYFGDLYDENDDYTRNCAACKRKVKKLREKENLKS